MSIAVPAVFLPVNTHLSFFVKTPIDGTSSGRSLDDTV